MAYTFDNPKAPSTRNLQYFELGGNRAIYSDGWIACTTPPVPPWSPSGPDIDPIWGFNWELYHVDVDFSEANDLARQEPDKLKQLQLLFYTQAAKYNVLPIDASKTARLDPTNRPSMTRGHDIFVYHQGTIRIPEGAAPDTKNKSFSIEANIETTKDGEQGMIVTQGGLFAGWALYLTQGKPVFHYNFVNVDHYNIASTQPLGPGKHKIEFEFAYDGGGIGKGGTGKLSVDGQQVAQGRIEKTMPIRITLDEGFDVGEDTGTPVNLTYDVPFRFPGKIEQVTLRLKPGAEQQPLQPTGSPTGRPGSSQDRRTAKPGVTPESN